MNYENPLTPLPQICRVQISLFYFPKTVLIPLNPQTPLCQGESRGTLKAFPPLKKGGQGGAKAFP